MVFSVPHPFGAEPVPEVPLPRAPLVRVVAQIRFPLITSIEKRAFVGAFQEAVRKDYPVLNPEHEVGLVITPQGPQSTEGTIWRFYDRTNQWKLSLASGFLALDTSAYTSRDDFLERFGRALRALEQHIGIGVFDRLGVRYVDRIQERDATFGSISELFRPEVLGMLAVDPGAGGELHIAVSENLFHLGETKMRARCASVPKDMTVDPSILEPINARSWVLDLDMFSEGRRDFDLDVVLKNARDYAAAVYRFFRWSASNELIRRAGGKL